MVLNYSLGWLGKLILQREINEGAGEKLPNVLAKRPGVTGFTEDLTWDPTPEVPVAAGCKPFVREGMNVFGHAHSCDFGNACGPRLAQLVIGDFPFEGRYCKEQGMVRRQLSRARGIDGTSVI